MKALLGLTQRTVEVGDTTQTRLCLDCGSCNATFIVPSRARLPDTIIRKKAMQAGWVAEWKGNHRCPACQEKEKQDVAKVKSLDKIGQIYPIKGAADKPPREMTKADRLKIFRRLNDVYDDGAGRYCDHWTDHLVAQDLSVPRKWVEDIRQENFGPCAENDEFAVLAGNLASLWEDIQAAEDMSVRADEMVKEALTAAHSAKANYQRAKAQFDNLRAALGPQGNV